MSRTTIGAGMRPSALKAIGHRLLLGDHLFGHRRKAELRAIDGALLRGDVDAGGLGEQRRHLVAMRARPLRRLGDLFVDRRHDIGVRAEKIAVDEKIAVLDRRLRIDRQRARLLFQFGDGVERIPDRPGVDRAAPEGRRRVGGREIDGVDVAPGNALALQRRNQQIVGARTPGDADLLALEIRQRLGRRIRGRDDRLPVAARRDHRRVGDLRARRLREDRRRVAGVAVVDGAGVDGLEQRRTEGELHPFDRHALRREAALQKLLRFHDEQDRGLLIADAQLRNRRGASGRRKRAGKTRGAEEKSSSIHG